MAITKEDILEAVSNLTVMELNDLVKAFEEKFGYLCRCFGCCRWRCCQVALLPLKKTEFDVII